MVKSLALLAGSTLLLGVAVTVQASMKASAPTNVERGRELFVAKGCYACHGYNGQGALTGPKLAPDPIDLEALKGFIRNSGPTAMPAYSAHLVNDAEAADIHAWLARQPKTRDPASIPLLSH